MTTIKCRGVWRFTARGDIVVLRERKPNNGPAPKPEHYRTVSRVVERAPGLSRAYRVTQKARDYLAELAAEKEGDNE